MTLATTISAGDLTLIRSGGYHAQQFVAAVPDVVVVQFQPSANPSDSVYAEISVGTIASGSMSDIKSYQTVIYSTTTDYGATETYRTYVRKVSGTTVLYVGQNGQSLTTSMYVTVLNTYEPFEKPRTIRNGVEYADWDITFRRLPPVESDLPTAVVLIDGATAYSPTANPQAIDADATATFTHAWESSNSNDTLDAGGTTNNPTFTLEAAAHRWIRYTFTDSNGNANVRVISIWTVPKSLASVVTLGFKSENADVANISYQQGSGWTCDVPAHKDISSIRKGTMICVFSIETYNGIRGSIESNVDFVGYLGDEQTVTRGAPDYGKISETRFTVDGFASKLATTPVSTLSITENNSPNEWGEVEKPTPVRMSVYILVEHTTISHLCAFRFPSNHTDFIAPGTYFESQSTIVSDSLKYQADAMEAIIQYGHDGILDMTQNLVQLDDTARDAAPVVAAMTPGDWLSYEISRQPTPIMRFLELYAGVYNTTTGVYSTYQAYSPPTPDIRGITEEQRNNIVLTTDSSQSDAIAELKQRCANLYAALNPIDILRMTFKSEWRFFQPDVGAWYTFTVALTDTIRGVSYDSNTRWQLLEIGYTTNNETGLPETTGTFRRETQNTGANVIVAATTTNANNAFNALPGTLPPFTGGDLDLTGGNWFDSFDPSPPTQQQPAGGGCEIVGFRPLFGTGTSTVDSALSGESVNIAVQGFGRLQGTSGVNDDFTSTMGTWTAEAAPNAPFPGSGFTIASGNSGTYSAGVGWVHGDRTRSAGGGGTDERIVQFWIDLGAIYNITNMSLTFDLTKGTYFDGSEAGYGLNYSKTGTLGSYTAGASATFNSMSSGNGQTVAFSDSDGVEARYIMFFVRSSYRISGWNGAVTLTAASVTGNTKYGDALYEWIDGGTPQAYGAGDGLLVDNQQPSGIPPYSDSHTYALYYRPIPQSGPVLLDFESPYSLDTMENWSIQAEVCFLGVP